MSEKLSNAQVLQLIRDHVSDMRTATLYIRTDQNRLVIVAIRQGDIVTLSSGPKHGEKAIPLLREMQSAVVRVEDEAVPFHSESVPPTTVLMAMLEGDTARQVPVGDETPQAGGGTDLETQRITAVLADLLSEYLGPVAPVFCEQVVGSLARPLNHDRLVSAVEKLATEAGGPQEAEDFRKRAREQLKL